jgi:maltose alpha-D-glucosyltransferase/alpha-amylase
MAASRASSELPGGPLWYKDAIIYQLHVKAFFDANGDGVGDFAGLTTKLDYIRDLGVNTIWLLPFYPSPMRDDGYDISDYRTVHAEYGTRGDFRRFVREAHRRGLRVITELVINHTSDQHRWFQAARHAKPGSARRDWYVWSDTDTKWPETRIIFTDSETSNWAWDPVARAYYWHRFFSHQPDLNFDNPRVLQAVIKLMRLWFDQGVDGLRLDAIPYLIERDGTNNENLPETHDVIREMRRVVDEHYDDRMVLAEANQWPEDVREYFGDGDECHMAYHFPLMPRMYMAVALEDRHPIVEIMRQTPEIPPSCQWAIFLRNHDELTLEMVTDRERDYMYERYGSDPRMRVNVGIRRRLAPLMDNDVDRIRLMNSLLMSMPGSPVIYYGDEIGMGDNVFLGDRNGVRTPMQWSPDRNAGFSKADPQRLYLPPIMDPLYGYEAVNVESQARDPSSLLNWMRRLIAVRRSHRAFGRGTIEFLRPGNRKILAYLRRLDDEVILCVANLSRSAQPVELDLGRFRGRVPIELMGQTAFPPVGDLPYLLTLPRHAVYWFRLAVTADVPEWHEDRLRPIELPVLVLADAWDTFFPERVESGRRRFAELIRTQLEEEILPAYLPVQRWFGLKQNRIEATRVAGVHEWCAHGECWLLSFVDVDLDDGTTERWFLPLSLAWGEDEERWHRLLPVAIAKVRHRANVGILYDAFADARFAHALIDAMRAERSLQIGDDTLHFTRTRRFDEIAGHDAAETTLRRPAVEGSNSAAIIGDRLFLKGFRRLRPGVHPEVEIGRFLTDVAAFDRAVPVAGALELRSAAGPATTLAVLQGFVQNQGDAWSYTVDHVVRVLEAFRMSRDGGAPESTVESYSDLARLLGTRTAGMHRALARTTGDRAFDPEPAGDEHLAEWRDTLERDAQETLRLLEAGANTLGGEASGLAARVLSQWQEMLAAARALLPARIEGARTRYHGDYHLGQVLLADGDVVIVDFEGEPGRTLLERRAKHSPLRDVAGMLRSFDYAAHVALDRMNAPHDRERIAARAQEWLRHAEAAYLDAYLGEMADEPTAPAASAARDLIRFFSFEKALYEVRYELGNRPDWVRIPMHGLLRLTGAPPRPADRIAHARRHEPARH